MKTLPLLIEGVKQDHMAFYDDCGAVVGVELGTVPRVFLAFYIPA